MIDFDKITITESRDTVTGDTKLTGQYTVTAFVTIASEYYHDPAAIRKAAEHRIKMQIWKQAFGELDEPLYFLQKLAAFIATNPADVIQLRELSDKIHELLKKPEREV